MTRTRLKELAAKRRRFDWRSLKLLEHETTRMNHKKQRRRYAEQQLLERRYATSVGWDFRADTLTDS